MSFCYKMLGKQSHSFGTVNVLCSIVAHFYCWHLDLSRIYLNACEMAVESVTEFNFIAFHLLVLLLWIRPCEFKLTRASCVFMFSAYYSIHVSSSVCRKSNVNNLHNASLALWFFLCIYKCTCYLLYVRRFRFSFAFLHWYLFLWICVEVTQNDRYKAIYTNMWCISICHTRNVANDFW